MLAASFVLRPNSLRAAAKRRLAGSIPIWRHLAYCKGFNKAYNAPSLTLGLSVTSEEPEWPGGWRGLLVARADARHDYHVTTRMGYSIKVLQSNNVIMAVQ
jgi:hypothetical protein